MQERDLFDCSDVICQQCNKSVDWIEVLIYEYSNELELRAFCHGEMDKSRMQRPMLYDRSTKIEAKPFTRKALEDK